MLKIHQKRLKCKDHLLYSQHISVQNETKPFASAVTVPTVFLIDNRTFGLVANVLFGLFFDFARNVSIDLSCVQKLTVLASEKMRKLVMPGIRQPDYIALLDNMCLKFRISSSKT